MYRITYTEGWTCGGNYLVTAKMVLTTEALISHEMMNDDPQAIDHAKALLRKQFVDKLGMK